MSSTTSPSPNKTARMTPGATMRPPVARTAPDFPLRSRSFDPTTGQFLSVDPLGVASGDSNFYRYVANSPINQVDPSGEVAEPRLSELLRQIDGELAAGRSVSVITPDGLKTFNPQTDRKLIRETLANAAEPVVVNGIQSLVPPETLKPYHTPPDNYPKTLTPQEWVLDQAAESLGLKSADDLWRPPTEKIAPFIEDAERRGECCPLFNSPDVQLRKICRIRIKLPCGNKTVYFWVGVLGKGWTVGDQYIILGRDFEGTPQSFQKKCRDFYEESWKTVDEAWKTRPLTGTYCKARDGEYGNALLSGVGDAAIVLGPVGSLASSPQLLRFAAIASGTAAAGHFIYSWGHFFAGNDDESFYHSLEAIMYVWGAVDLAEQCQTLKTKKPWMSIPKEFPGLPAGAPVVMFRTIGERVTAAGLSISDDAIVNFGSVARDVVSPLTGTRSYWWRYGDIKHLTPKQLQLAIGDLASAGQPGGATVMRVSASPAQEFTLKPPTSGVGINEYAIDTPVPISMNATIGE